MLGNGMVFCGTGVRTNTPDDANKKPQLTVWCFWLSVVHPSRLILNTFVLMPLRASSLCSSSKMHAHLVELGVRTYSPDDANKKTSLLVRVWCFWLSVVHPSGLFAAMPLTPLGSPSLCFGDVSRLALGSN